jgi:hypothetical protein
MRAPLTDAEAWSMRAALEAEAATALLKWSRDDPRSIDLARRIEAAKAQIGRRRWEQQTHAHVHGGRPW